MATTLNESNNWILDDHGHYHIARRKILRERSGTITRRPDYAASLDFHPYLCAEKNTNLGLAPLEFRGRLIFHNVMREPDEPESLISVRLLEAAGWQIMRESGGARR
jgi:hypothetical protein